jgi:hypothetical protein
MKRAALALLGLAGCADEPPPVVCDGSSTIRLAVQVLGGGTIEGGESVLHENGTASFFLDGRCEYYVRWGDNLRSDVRTGVLLDTDRLARGLQLAAIEDHEGGYSGDWLDGSGPRISFDGHAVSCGSGCEGGNVPGWLEDVNDFVHDEFPAIYEASAAPDLPQRLVLVDQEGQVGRGSFPWPAAVDPATLAITELEASTLGFGESTLAVGADGSALRELRRFVGDGGAPSIYIAPTQDQQPPDYRLYVRDSIPWEDENGLVPVD